MDIQAYKTSWGLKVPGKTRGLILGKLADLIEANADEFAALESLNVGTSVHTLIIHQHVHVYQQESCTGTLKGMSRALYAHSSTLLVGQIRFMARRLR